MFFCRSEKLLYIPHTFLDIYFQCSVKKVPWSNNCLCLSAENKCNGFSILHHFDFEDYTVNTSSKKITLTIKFKRDRKSVKKPLHLKMQFFLSMHLENLHFLLFNSTDTIQKLQLLYQRILTDILLQSTRPMKQVWFWLCRQRHY